MKKARGNTRKMLRAFGRIQDLAGQAQTIYNNDRDQFRADKIKPVLSEISKIAIDIQSNYEPVNDNLKKEVY